MDACNMMEWKVITQYNASKAAALKQTNKHECPGWCGSVDWALAWGSLVWFPVRAHTWVSGQVPSRGHMRQPHINVSLPLFLPPFPSLKINKYNLKKRKTIQECRNGCWETTQRSKGAAILLPAQWFSRWEWGSRHSGRLRCCCVLRGLWDWFRACRWWQCSKKESEDSEDFALDKEIPEGMVEGFLGQQEVGFRLDYWMYNDNKCPGNVGRRPQVFRLLGVTSMGTYSIRGIW